MDLIRARLSRRALFLAATASGLTAGCAPAPEPGGSPSAVAPPTTPAATPTVRFATGGTVRLPIGALPVQWNPWHADGDTAEARAVRAPLSAPAFVFDTGGTPRPNPALVSSASAAGTPTVATLRLNPLARWGDGEPVTAADWVATWRAVAAGYPGRALPGWDQIAEIRAGADQDEVIVRYTTTVADWTRPLADGPAHADSVADTGAFSWTSYRPGCFAGPFVLAHTDERQQLLTLEPNPHWWGDPVHLDSVVFRVVRPDATAAGVAAGEFDLWSPPDSGTLERAKSAADTAVRSVAGTTARALEVTTTGVLADARVRQALIRAIDRAKLTEAALAEYGSEPLPWSHPLLLPQQPGYTDLALETGLDHDLAAAAAALTEAGWPLVSGRRQNDSGPLELTFTVAASDERAAGERAGVAVDLATLGVAVSAVPEGGDLTPIDLPLPRYPLAALTRRAADVPGVEGLAGTIATTLDGPDREVAVNQAGHLLWQDARTIPLYVRPDLAVARNRLTNAGPTGLASVRWEDVGWSA